MSSVIERRSGGQYFSVERAAHVTTRDIALLVASGVDVRVIDRKTGEDVTNSLLAKIIAESDPGTGAMKDVASWVADTAEKAAVAGREFLEQGVEQLKPYTEPVADFLGDAVTKADELTERIGVKKPVVAGAHAISERLDILSGKKILDEVVTRLASQDKYNDVLATKLFEALERIKLLEDKLGVHR